MRRVIALITDFGYKDPYAGVMKGVIKKINPQADVVDVTHGIERHDIRQAALVLLYSARYFPEGTVFVCVVDPGVGSARRALLVKTKRYILLGPDNGCLYPLASSDGIELALDISRSKYRLEKVSSTFHGRDVFAPVAAHVSAGAPVEEAGEPVDPGSLVRLEFPRPTLDPKSGRAMAELLYVDVFGNLVTNVTSEDVELLGWRLGERLAVRTPKNSVLCTYTLSFSLVGAGEPACYIGSFDLLEVAINMGNAAAVLGAGVGDSVEIARA